MISCLTFKSSVHFELIFGVWYKIVVQFHSFACGCAVSQELSLLSYGVIFSIPNDVFGLKVYFI